MVGRYVVDVYIPRERGNREQHRGICFVTFETEAGVERMMAGGKHVLNGSPVAVDRALPRGQDPSGRPPPQEAGYRGPVDAWNGGGGGGYGGGYSDPPAPQGWGGGGGGGYHLPVRNSHRSSGVRDRQYHPY